MRLEHPIFRTPLAPKIELIEIDTPKGYASWPEGRDLPATMKAWRVQTVDFPKIDVGVVSDPYGLEDSPDGEWISSGVNSKGSRSVALGRHGNYFLWGFFGDPRVLTDSAKQVFLNTVCYMKQHDRRPITGRSHSGRMWSQVYVGYVSQHQDKKENGWIRDLFPESVQSETEMDTAKLRAYYTENLEYLRPADRGFELDPDAKAFGVSNRKLEMLDKIVELLATDAADPRAKRLVDRYLPDQSACTSVELAAWLKKNRRSLFFSDVGGFRWFIDPLAVGRVEGQRTSR